MSAPLSDDGEYPNLAEDPDVAFRQLEKQFRAEMDEHLERSDGHNSDTFTLSYINRTVAAAKTLEIEPLKNWEVPSHRGNVWDEYQEFRTVVEHYLVQVQNPAQPPSAWILRAARQCNQVKNPALP